jgi:hypothetical protein
VKKEIWAGVKSFIFFESPLQTGLISQFFSETHDRFQKLYPHWSFEATRKKVIYRFWSGQVAYHYLAIFILAALLTAPFIYSRHLFLLSFSVAGLLSFMVILSRIYWPVYFSDFLPILDTIIAEKQKIQDAELELKKCKRTQFSIPTLTIIYYVFSKTSNIPLLAANDRSAELLNQIYGVDRDKIKQNLSRLYQISKLSPKERAEIEKGIDKAREFFDSLSSPNASQILDQLDLKLLKD